MMDISGDTKLWKKKPLPIKDFVQNMNADAMKSTVTIPVYMLQVVCLFPESKSNWKKLFLWTYMINAWIMYLFNAMYFIKNARNLEIMARTMPIFCSHSQIIAKGLGLFLFQDLLNKALYLNWGHFWPCKWLNKDELVEVVSISKLFIKFQQLFPIISLGLTFIFIVPALIRPLNNRELGMELLLPDIKYTTPFYELIIIWQIMVFPQGIWTVLAFDFTFIAVVLNLATQFRILKNVLERVGNGRENFDDVNEQDRELVVKCIKHHNTLLQYCCDLNTMYTYVVFSQFFVSGVGVCISAVLFSVYEEGRVMMLGYCFIYMLQIFMYCLPGNELKHHSTTLTDGIMKCKWYLCSPGIQKMLIPLMARCKRSCAISVGHFFELDMKNGINVMKMAFSFFTLLDNMLRMKTGKV